jgi:SAM-dependent methyltransferase
MTRIPLRRAANKLFLRNWTRKRLAPRTLALAERHGIAGGFRDEIRFWALELSGCGYHPEILDRLKPHGMAADFPAVLYPLLEKLHRKPARVADVGSGPLSQLAYGAYTGRMALTAIDPLADVYTELLGGKREAAAYRRLAVPAEQLSETLGAGTFDIIWTRNAIDHSQDPARAFQSMVDALALGGFLVMTQFSREGTAEKWHGLHQHDMYLDETNRLILQSFENGILGVPRCLSDDCRLVLLQSSGPTPGVKETFEIVWQKQ